MLHSNWVGNIISLNLTKDESEYIRRISKLIYGGKLKFCFRENVKVIEQLQFNHQHGNFCLESHTVHNETNIELLNM